MVLDREVLFLLFCLDGWPLESNKFGVGCHWGSSFAGAFSFFLFFIFIFNFFL